MSATPPNEPWNDPWNHPESGHGSEPPPPPDPGGGYPPPPPDYGRYPPPPPDYGGYPPPPGGYPPPPPGYGGYPNYPGPTWDRGYGPSSTPSEFGILAGWWYRVGATIIDGIILFIPNLVFRAAFSYAAAEALAILVGVVYYVALLSQRGQTVGNMAVGTRVIDARNGGPVSVGKALVRWVTELLLAILFFFPLILDILWPLWDRRKQTLHDKAAGTLVIKVR